MGNIKKISLKDIAEAAGVSTALVSFVLNGKAEEYRVSPETSKRVFRIASELNYQPNQAAKSLRSGKTSTVGFVMSDIANPFFAQLARFLENYAAQSGYTVLFGSSDENADKMRRVVSSLINKGVDGLIIVPCENSEDYIRQLVRSNVPVVLFDRYFPDINVSYVALNNFNATYTATKHLLGKGYASPAIVAYDMNLIHMKERIRGYKVAMEEAGLKRQATVIYLKQDSPRKSAEKLLPKALESGADAFIFATNMISQACLYALKDNCMDKRCDIGLVGFDGSPLFDFFCSPISYVLQPIEMLMQKAFEILMENISNGNSVQSVLAEGILVPAQPPTP